MLYNKRKIRPLETSDLTPYLELIGQKRPVLFTVTTRDRERIHGTILEFEPREKDGRIDLLKIIAATAEMQDPFGRKFGDDLEEYPLSFDNPILLHSEKNGHSPSSLSLKAGREDITIKLPLSSDVKK